MSRPNVVVAISGLEGDINTKVLHEVVRCLEECGATVNYPGDEHKLVTDEYTNLDNLEVYVQMES